MGQSDISQNQIKKDLLLKENIIKSSSSTIATCDLEGFMTYVNPSFFKLWGFDSHEEVVGRHFSEFWMVEGILGDILAKLNQTGEWFGDVRAKKKDGSLFTVQVMAATVYDEKGEPIALTSTSIDITERMQMENDLRDSEIKHKALVNNIPGMVYRAFPDWSAEVISGSMTVCGYTEKELNSKDQNWLSIIHKDDIEAVFQNGSKLTRVQKQIVQRYRITTKDGDIRWVEDRKTSLFSKTGEFIGIDGIVFDITDQKKAEEEREKLIGELQEAIENIKTLSGLIPICSTCKKIRDDKGYWNLIESYIESHSTATFSHGMCPECSDKMYGGKEWYVKMKEGKQK